VLALAHLVAPEGVDGAPFGGGHQPGTRIGRDSGPRPFGEGNDQHVLRQLLGKVDIPYHAGQAGDEPRPFNAKGPFDRLVRLACGHTAFSAKAAGWTSQIQPTVSGEAELSALPVTGRGEFLRRQKLGQIRRLVERPDFDLARARHGIGAAFRPGHGLAMPLTSQIEKPATSLRTSANGPSMTVRPGPSKTMRLAWALFLRPAPATNTPALTSSSVNRSIAANPSAVGGTPFSLSSVAFANTITRTSVSLFEPAPLASHRDDERDVGNRHRSANFSRPLKRGRKGRFLCQGSQWRDGRHWRKVFYDAPVMLQLLRAAL